MENLNSVCYVTTVTELKPIDGADRIELAVINGWNCIVKRGQYKVNDLVVIATTDAVIPQELSDELNVTEYLRKGQRVRTVRLKGVYSECLIIPVTYVYRKTTKVLVSGMDVMDILGIYKYEPPVKQIQLSSGKKIRYTENVNFQIYYKFPNAKNVPKLFSETDTVQITRKLHGTNARFGIVKKNKISVLDKIKKFFKLTDKWFEYEFVVGSHNVEKGSDSQGYYDTNVWYQIADKFQIKRKLFEFVKQFGPDVIGSGFTIYGEIYGPGIQKNYDYKLSEIDFAAFDIVKDGKYLDTYTTQTIVEEQLGLKHVPVLYEGKWSKEIQDKYTFNNNISGTKIPHEGIVVKCISGDRHKVAKVINPEYLVYGEKHDVGDSH
jgi:RNA ligase (TIGR02306 family)